MWLGHVAVFVLAAVYLGLGSTAVQERLRPWGSSPWRGAIVACSLWLACAVAAFSTSSPATAAVDMAIVAIYVAVPLMALTRRDARPPADDLSHALAVVSLWLPIELGLLPKIPVPMVAGLVVPASRLLAIDLALVLFLVIRPLDGLGYAWALRGRDLGVASAGAALFALVAIPVGLAIGFVAPSAARMGPVRALAAAVVIFVLVALPEEILFRGIVQNRLEQRFGRTMATAALAALLFGLTHVNNPSAHHGVPNGAYVLMATLAGLAYGWVWRRTGRVTASALTHTLVNLVWGVWFRV